MLATTNQRPSPTDSYRKTAETFAARSVREITCIYREILDQIAPLPATDEAMLALGQELIDRLRSSHFSQWKADPVATRQALLLYERCDQDWQANPQLPASLKPLFTRLQRPSEMFRTALKAWANV